MSPDKQPSAPVEDFNYGYVGVTTPHCQLRLSCLAPQPTGIYAPCPMKGQGCPWGEYKSSC
ncbi:MAG: hypothetical protein OIN86_02465 [Candidatus Methanoperedens sp.]|nr:hypothetical protein [Candidatus Methanoperedens sp.]